jgi:hypothetical protein
MTEGLFILTTIFVAYVVYQIVSEQKAAAKPHAPAAKSEAQAAVAEQPKPQAAVAKEKPAVAKAAAPKAEASKPEPSKPAAAKPAASKSATAKAPAKPAAKVAAKPASTKAAAAKSAPAPTAKSAGLKNPKTGEVVATYSNYRFTKRWIKDALVEEGLLDKVYAGNELNADTETKIKAAIAKLEAMDKYKA